MRDWENRGEWRKQTLRPVRFRIAALRNQLEPTSDRGIGRTVHAAVSTAKRWGECYRKTGIAGDNLLRLLLAV